MTPAPTHVTPESVSQRILLIRWRKVMINADLADLYHVPTKAFNQAIRRNLERFPLDFMFQLTTEEKQEMAISPNSNSPCRYRMPDISKHPSK